MSNNSINDDEEKPIKETPSMKKLKKKKVKVTNNNKNQWFSSESDKMK
jgi:hypothetical protein